MKKHLPVSLLMAFSLFCIAGCNEDTSAETPSSGEQTCDPDCTNGTVCVDGVCQCGDTVCDGDEICKSGKCTQKGDECTGDDCHESETGDSCDGKCSLDETCVDGECRCGGKKCDDGESCKAGVCEKTDVTCVGDDCKEPDAECDGKCRTGETCVDGECKCGDMICKADETCNAGICEKAEETCTGDDCEISETGDPCNGSCNADETCVEGECLCGESKCTEHQICKAGSCEDELEDPPGEEDKPVECEPACSENDICEDGTCVPKDPPASGCNPACDESTEYCDEHGVCQKKEDESCSACAADETCDHGVCKCGDSICKENEQCSNGACKPIDPCAKISCKSGETCVDGTCKVMAISITPANLDVMLSSVSDKMVATNSNESDLVWKVNGKGADQDLSGLRCRKNDGTVSKKLSECIVKDKAKKTETVQFVGHSRHLTTMTVTVENDAKAKAEATLTLKPYFDMDGFVQLSSLVYKNGYAPGHHVKNYPGNKESDNELKANLGGIETKYGPANPYGKQIFTEEELKVIDNDMFVNYIRPHMLQGDDGKYYGTRASVVAAARFLILQFPYDIPYYSGALNNTIKALSHYVFNIHDSKKSKLSEIGIMGLNLTSNVYNSATSHEKSNILRENVVPWGAAYSCVASAKGCNASDEYPYNGLECSGFVTWAFRNGQLGLGDWKTLMFAKSGACKPNGKVLRNYRCENIVNNKDNKYAWSNMNNGLTSAYKKLNRLNDSDFIKLNNISESNLQKKLKEVKAGDLLWLGAYTDKQNDLYKNGHVAMIIGIKRNSSGALTHIEVGEATGNRSGNKLTKYTIAEFIKSGWVNTTSNASFLIRMDNVFDYYSEKSTKPTNEKSDCPNNVNTGGNCYKYTDMYNEAFNSAIVNKSLK